MSGEQLNPYQSPGVVAAEIETGDAGGISPLLDGRLSKTGLGLKMVYWGILTFLLGCITVMIGGIAVSAFDSNSWMETIFLWLYLGGIGVGFALLNLGPVLCLTVPRGYGLLPYAIATVVGLVVSWAMILVMAWVVPFFALQHLLIMSITPTLFLAFLHRLSRVIGREDLRRRCRAIFAIGAILFVLLLGGSVMSRMTPADLSVFALVWIVLFFVGGLVLFVSYANVVNALANAILHPESRRQPVGIL